MHHQPLRSICWTGCVSGEWTKYSRIPATASTPWWPPSDTVPEQLPNVLDRAIRIAVTRRAPTAVIIPSDVQELEYTPPTHALKMVPSSLGIRPPSTQPDMEAIRGAADLLNQGKKVAMLIGHGARGAAAEVREVADLLGAGVAKALLGKDSLPDDLPYVTGSIGLLGTRPSYEMMRDCDTLLTIGSNFPYPQFMPEAGQARGVQIDIDPAMIGLRYPYEFNIVGGAPAFTESQSLPDVDYAAFAASLEQALNTAKALAKGDDSTWDIIKATVKTKAQEILPGKEQ